MAPFRVGLTGGIASGKSLVADLFAARGVPVIDTDVLAREAVRPGEPALEEIRRRFGAAVLAEDGTLDRRRLRERVFADEDERRALEGILHPRLRAAALAASEKAGGPYQVIVVPLLVGSSLRRQMDRVLVVDCSVETQIARLTARDAETEARARRMIEAQASREERLAIADDVLVNEGSVEDAERRVEALHRRYLALAAAARP